MTNLSTDGAALKQSGMRLVTTGRLHEAAEVFASAYSLNQHDVEALLALGIVNGMLGNYVEAEHRLHEVIRINPRMGPAYYNLGIAQKFQGKLADAADSYRQAIAQQPDIPDYHNNLGSVLLDMNDSEEAIKCFSAALMLKPDSPDYFCNIAKALKIRGLREEAANAYRKALDLRMDFPTALKGLGSVLLSLSEPTQAVTYYQKAIAIDPNDHDAIAGLATALSRSRKYTQAYEVLKPYLHDPSGDSNSPAITISFASISQYIGKSQLAAQLMEQQLQNNRNLTSDDSAQMHFRLGHFYDSTSKYDVAFEHFLEGNKLRSSRFDIGDLREIVDEIISVFNEELYIDTAQAGNPTETPIFIVGMPRSGTTLVEQILASHPAVFGAGELDKLPNLISSAPILAGTGNSYAEILAGLKPEHISTLAGAYLDHIRSMAPDALRVTDKMPSNFLNLGFIALFFPNANIIHCKRDPIDTCLSCFFQDFAGHHPYSSDLHALGEHYKQYCRLMEHWKKTLRMNVFELDYENLVTDLEGTCSSMLNYCGLDWDAACLDFHLNKRPVITASADQVTRRLYKSSIGRWRNYESHIDTLINSLSSRP